MRESDIAALAVGEEKVEFAGRVIIVRELDCASKVPNAEGLLAIDYSIDLLVLCAFEEDGSPVFRVDDIPALRKSGRRKIRALLNATLRVNGLDVKADVKNSEAAPASG